MILPLIFAVISDTEKHLCCWTEQVGTAYGVVTAIQNGGLALFPIIVGGLRSHFGSYAPWSLSLPPSLSLSLSPSLPLPPSPLLSSLSSLSLSVSLFSLSLSDGRAA